MIQRIYIDTSVVGGIYDSEFDIFTKMFFDKAFRGEIRLIISELLEEELINAPERVKDFFRTLPTNQLELVRLTKEAIVRWSNKSGHKIKINLCSHGEEKS
jgi:hypothetical protein